MLMPSGSTPRRTGMAAVFYSTHKHFSAMKARKMAFTGQPSRERKAAPWGRCLKAQSKEDIRSTSMKGSIGLIMAITSEYYRAREVMQKADSLIMW